MLLPVLHNAGMHALPDTLGAPAWSAAAAIVGGLLALALLVRGRRRGLDPRGSLRRSSRLVTNSMGVLVLTLTVVAGLVNVPTACRCGADIPHEHALLFIGHHHHGHAGEDSAGQPIAADADGPVVHAPGMPSPDGQAPTATLASLGMPTAGGAAALTPDPRPVPTGTVLVPESPPPQV